MCYSDKIRNFIFLIKSLIESKTIPKLRENRENNKVFDTKNSRRIAENARFWNHKFEPLVTLKIPTQFSIDKCKQKVNKMRNVACRKIKFGKKLNLKK